MAPFNSASERLKLIKEVQRRVKDTDLSSTERINDLTEVLDSLIQDLIIQVREAEILADSTRGTYKDLRDKVAKLDRLVYIGNGNSSLLSQVQALHTKMEVLETVHRQAQASMDAKYETLLDAANTSSRELKSLIEKVRSDFMSTDVSIKTSKINFWGIVVTAGFALVGTLFGSLYADYRGLKNLEERLEQRIQQLNRDSNYQPRLDGLQANQYFNSRQ
jgi:hypothetical protein